MLDLDSQDIRLIHCFVFCIFIIIEICVQDLLQNKARLEHDLKIKSNSLFIDREKCLSIRKSFPVVSLATKL